MHKIFRDGENIAYLNGTISGGLTLSVESLTELGALQALCLQSGELAEFADRILEYDQWLREYERNRREYEMRVEKDLEMLSDKSPDECSDLQRLFLELTFIGEIWKDLPEEDSAGLLALTCVNGSGVEMDYQAEVPALFFHDGSLLSTITPYAPRLGKFAMVIGFHGVAIARKAGVMQSIHADKLVENMRKAAEKRAVFKDLPQLEDVTPADTAGKRGVLLLLHGLFSTDLGTFDGFIKAWQRPPMLSFIETELLTDLWKKQFPEKAKSESPSPENFRDAFREALEKDFLIVGWPHDTMTKIKTNAESLFEDILSKLGSNSPPIVLVCHSRGGLVARKLAVVMQEQGPPWQDKVRLCVTFGTPHRGAALAESTFQYVAAVAAYMNGTGRAMSVCRVLDYYSSAKHFEGIEDLRPMNAPGSDFLGELVVAERNAGKPLARKLDIMPVGAVYTGPKRRWARFMSGMLGTDEHDLVVPRKSSLPGKSFPGGELARCGHSDYFDDTQIEEPHFANVLEKIRQCLDVQTHILTRVVATPKSSAPTADDFARMIRSTHRKPPKRK